MSPDRVARLLAALSAAYRVNVSPETISVYAAALAGEDDDAVDKAGGECIRLEEFFPSVATLLKHLPTDVPTKRDVCADCGSVNVVGKVGHTPYCGEHFRVACDDARSAMKLRSV